MHCEEIVYGCGASFSRQRAEKGEMEGLTKSEMEGLTSSKIAGFVVDAPAAPATMLQASWWLLDHVQRRSAAVEQCEVRAGAIAVVALRVRGCGRFGACCSRRPVRRVRIAIVTEATVTEAIVTPGDREEGFP